MRARFDGHIDGHPMHEAIYNLMGEIEKLPASRQQTTVVMAAGDLHHGIAQMRQVAAENAATLRRPPKTTRKDMTMSDDNENPASGGRCAPPAGSMRCEGWRRYGGAVSLGPVEWKQCESDGTVMLKLDQGGAISELPACQHCWNEALGTEGIIVIEAKPILSNDEVSHD